MCLTGFTGELGVNVTSCEVREQGLTDGRGAGRYFTEDTVDPIAICAGLIQTGLFSGEHRLQPFLRI